MTIRSAPAFAQPGEIEPLLDHVVYATPDLASSVAEFQQLTGVTPAAGGRHIGLGTRNYLVALGPSCYLEIVGPDTEHPADPGVAMPFGLADLTVPRLITWAVQPANLHTAVEAYAAVGVDLGEIRHMQRARSDGQILRWQLALPALLPFGGVVPFVIDWGDTPHPTSGALPRTDLRSLHASHPEPARVRHALDAIGVWLAVDAGGPGLTAIIATPRGPVQLS